jgi:hypothetical protein
MLVSDGSRYGGFCLNSFSRNDRLGRFDDGLFRFML